MTRTKKCTSRVIAGRLAKAEEFLDNAELLADDDDRRNAAAALFVDAGIAAADVLCCKRLGEHAQGRTTMTRWSYLGWSTARWPSTWASCSPESRGSAIATEPFHSASSGRCSALPPSWCKLPSRRDSGGAS